MEILYVGRLEKFVIDAILFKVHVTQKMVSLCLGAPFMLNVQHFLYIMWKCIIIFVGNLLNEMVMQCFWCLCGAYIYRYLVFCVVVIPAGYGNIFLIFCVVTWNVRIVFQHSYYAEQSRTEISVLTTKNKILRNYTKLRVPYIRSDQRQTKSIKCHMTIHKIQKIFPYPA